VAKGEEDIPSKLSTVKLHFEWTESVEWHTDLLKRIMLKRRRKTIAIKKEIVDTFAKLRLVQPKRESR
jgi:hypothetical protein